MWPDLPARAGSIASLLPHSAVLLIEPQIALGFSTASSHCRFTSSRWSANPPGAFSCKAFCQARPPQQSLGQWMFLNAHDYLWLRLEGTPPHHALLSHVAFCWLGDGVLGGPVQNPEVWPAPGGHQHHQTHKNKRMMAKLIFWLTSNYS